MKQKNYDVAIVGVTGLVGQAFLEVLEQRKFPIGKLYALASERSLGEVISFKNKDVNIETLADFDFSKVQFAFFSAGTEIASQYGELAAKKGCIVIDNSPRFRYEKDIPLIVPEVNAHRIPDYRKHNIVANPNCSTIQLVVALKPIYDAVGISRVNVATYQSVSGAGKDGIEELAGQIGDLFGGKKAVAKVMSKQIAFNVIPQIDLFQDNGYTKEEMKMVWETQKILEDNELLVNPTAVRVPVFYGHSEAVNMETKKPITVKKARELLRKAPGVVVVKEDDYPTPFEVSNDEDAVYVGRIRQDLSHPNGLNLWVVADNVRKGAALNAVQIAEEIINYQNKSLKH